MTTSNNSLTLTSLDFGSLKENFKEFLKTQSVFRDYNFEGSNINVLLDLLSYNTFMNSFYLNMVASESFMDSAQKYDSVVSHTKDLNYLPRGYNSAVANISMVLQTSTNIGTLTIPKGTKFSGTNVNGRYTFVTTETKKFTSTTTTFNVDSIDLFEGAYYTESYAMDDTDEVQRFVINNKNVDTNSITVQINENGSILKFKRAISLFGLDSASQVFFIQPSFSNKYEIIFGDNISGRRPINGSLIKIEYRTCNGKLANDISTFVMDDSINEINASDVNVVSITTNSVSSGGADPESIESIKFNAPRYYASQERAVGSDDYLSLILSEFSGKIDDAIVYGGETVEPKQYGTIIASLKPTTGKNVTDTIKNMIISHMSKYITMPMTLKIVDPDYIYCGIDTTVQYNKNSTSKSVSDLESLVLDEIMGYSNNNLEKFGRDLRFSQLSRHIDDSDSSIASNETELRLIKKISPLINYPTSYDIFLENELYNEFDGTTSNSSIRTEQYASSYENHIKHASTYSSQFTYNGQKTYSNCYIADDGFGVLKVYSVMNNKIVSVGEIGTVDYNTGHIKLNKISVSNYGTAINIYNKTKSKDLYATNNKIMLVSSSDVKVKIIEKQN